MNHDIVNESQNVADLVTESQSVGTQQCRHDNVPTRISIAAIRRDHNQRIGMRLQNERSHRMQQSHTPGRHRTILTTAQTVGANRNTAAGHKHYARIIRNRHTTSLTRRQTNNLPIERRIGSMAQAGGGGGLMIVNSHGSK